MSGRRKGMGPEMFPSEVSGWADRVGIEVFIHYTYFLAVESGFSAGFPLYCRLGRGTFYIHDASMYIIRCVSMGT